MSGKHKASDVNAAIGNVETYLLLPLLRTITFMFIDDEMVLFRYD